MHRALTLAAACLALPIVGSAARADTATWRAGASGAWRPISRRSRASATPSAASPAGTTPDPVYRASGDHIESVRIPFDEAQVSYRQNPRPLPALDRTRSMRGGQFCDRGREYTTAIFVDGPEQRRVAEEAVTAAEAELGQEIVTPILDAGAFYPVEDYHQDYYKSDDRLAVSSVGIAVPKKIAYKRYRQGLRPRRPRASGVGRRGAVRELRAARRMVRWTLSPGRTWHRAGRVPGGLGQIGLNGASTLAARPACWNGTPAGAVAIQRTNRFQPGMGSQRRGRVPKASELGLRGAGVDLVVADLVDQDGRPTLATPQLRDEVVERLLRPWWDRTFAQRAEREARLGVDRVAFGDVLAHGRADGAAERQDNRRDRRRTGRTDGGGGRIPGGRARW